MKSLKRWIIRILYSVVFAALYYIVFSYFFDTPIEHELKKSTRQLSERYESLTASFDSLSSVIRNIERRDSSVFEIVFEARPYRDSVGDHSTKVRDRLEGLSNRELSELFDSELAKAAEGVKVQNSEMRSILEYIDSASHEVNSIPSIQPVNNKDLTLLAASYGYRVHPFYKSMHFHEGIDYSVPIGTAIFATADGRVASIETKGQSSGLSLTLNHGDYQTFYGNLDKVLVRAGTHVMKGDIIAFSGDSGLSYAPHLHYEVRLNGEKVDPLYYFFGELSIDEIAKLRNIASVAMQSFD